MAMVIQPRLQHALKQKLVMSQQLRQAIHLFS
jgi:DNA-directed RNA polymerase specialized sigma54-like protein